MWSKKGMPVSMLEVPEPSMFSDSLILVSAVSRFCDAVLMVIVCAGGMMSFWIARCNPFHA